MFFLKYQSRLLLCCMLVCTTTLFAYRDYDNSPYTSQIAQVRIGNSLCAAEQTFITQRTHETKKALETLLGISLETQHIPRIALCVSGGGYRSMITFLGAIQGFNRTPAVTRSLHAKGLYETVTHYGLYLLNLIRPNGDHAAIVPLTFPSLGLLDCCTYVAGASGASWGIAGLIQSSMAPQQYLKNLETTLDKNIVDSVNIEFVCRTLLEKYSCAQPLSLIDLYGALLAQKLLINLGYNDPDDITIASQADLANTGKIPLPLYAAIVGNDSIDYEWIEFSPFEIGGQKLNAYIPTWAFNRLFDKGVSQNNTPPQTLGYCMGIWGSGISANMREFFDLIIRPQVGDVLSNYINPKLLKQEYTSVLDHRISPAQVFNWTFGTENTGMNKDQLLTLIDAGIACNIPVMPLINRDRAIDIIIILDATTEGTIGTELRKAEKKAFADTLPFPSIDYRKVQQLCSVHRDDTNPAAPIVIYMPLIKNNNYANGWDPRTEDFTRTLNFTYTKEQIALLSGLAQKNMLDSMPIIIDTLHQWIKKH